MTYQNANFMLETLTRPCCKTFDYPMRWRMKTQHCLSFGTPKLSNYSATSTRSVVLLEPNSITVQYVQESQKSSLDFESNILRCPQLHVAARGLKNAIESLL